MHRPDVSDIPGVAPWVTGDGAGSLGHLGAGIWPWDISDKMHLEYQKVNLPKKLTKRLHFLQVSERLPFCFDAEIGTGTGAL